MSNELSVPSILQIARIAQYLASGSISSGNNFKGTALDERLAIMIYCERRAVQYRYDQNPNDPTLQTTANYLYTLLGRFGLLARVRLASLSVAPPTISGPSSVTLNVGQNATFTVSVVSAAPYTLQWYDSNGNPIAGAIGLSYTFLNAQLTDSGKTFYVKATNPAGTVTSQTAVMIVQSALVGSYYFGATNFYAQLKAGIDNVPYAGNFAISNGQPLNVPFPLAAANDQCQVVRYPGSQSDKTIWNNTITNNGQIPDQAYMEIVVIGAFKYIISRGAISLDSTHTGVVFS